MNLYMQPQIVQEATQCSKKTRADEAELFLGFRHAWDSPMCMVLKTTQTKHTTFQTITKKKQHIEKLIFQML